MRQAVGVEDEINYYLCPKFEKKPFRFLGRNGMV